MKPNIIGDIKGFQGLPAEIISLPIKKLYLYINSTRGREHPYFFICLLHPLFKKRYTFQLFSPALLTLC